MNIELHERLMRVTIDTFKRETDKLKLKIAMLEASSEQVGVECYSMRAALMSNGFTQTGTGEWKPPLGKRPDVEGQYVVAAAMAFVQAQRNMYDAANKYEERPK